MYYGVIVDMMFVLYRMLNLITTRFVMARVVFLQYPSEMVYMIVVDVLLAADSVME